MLTLHRDSLIYPLVLAGGLALVTLLLQQFVSVRGTSNDVAFSHTPDIIVEDFKARTLDQNGQLEYLLTAEKMSYFQNDESTSLIKPSLTRTRPGASPLVVDSDRALVTRNGEQIHFIGHVLARTADDGKDGFTLRSELLQVIPGLHLIVSDRPVELTRSGTVVRAGSLNANTLTRIIQLGSRVVARYDPSKP